jgi:hypothetical protein
MPEGDRFVRAGESLRQKGQVCHRCASPHAGLFPAARRRGHIRTASPSRPAMISGNPPQQRNTRDAPGIRTRLRRLCRPPPTTSETCVMSGPRRSRTPACSLGQSRAVPCTMRPWCSQQESNLRRHLRRVASYPLDHRSLVRRDGVPQPLGSRHQYSAKESNPRLLFVGQALSH